MDALVKLFKQLEVGWDELRKNQYDEKFLATEFKKLLEVTLRLNLDFRLALRPDLISDEQKQRIREIQSNIKLDPNQIQLLNLISNVDNWISPVGQSLLSGKFIGHLTPKLTLLEKKFVREEDLIMESRIDTLMQLFETSNNEDVVTMILNAFETYRKIIVRDTAFQNKISCNTFDKLQRSYMVIMCHRRQYEHLYSMIKTLPHYRKIKYVASRCRTLTDSNPSKKKLYETKIAAACVEELLRCEFAKGRFEQNIHFFHFYLYHLADLATQDVKIKEDMERIILSANDMDVISDYYYLAATTLRFKMPNHDPNLVLKCISIGLSHDISYLEEVKYSTDGETILTNRGEVPREQEFILAHRRIHLALITLGFLIPHYPLARLCFHVASVCEHETNFCQALLNSLPECDYNDYDESCLDPVLINIRYLLEAFHYDIKGNTKLTTTYSKVSSCSFEKLDYFNHRVPLDNELRPLEYPGVEKYLKKQNTEDKTHVSQTSDLVKCINENAEFNRELGNGFKKLLNKYVKRNSQEYPCKSKVFEIAKEKLFHAKNVKFTTSNEVYTDLVSMTVEEVFSSDFKFVEDYIEKRQEENLDNLHFDWKFNDECEEGINRDMMELDEMYKSGIIKVLKLYRKGFCTIDIENILLFAIYEKKMKFLSEEFAYLNKNRNVELDINENQQHNQIHAGFLFIITRRHPEFCRLNRLTSSLKKYYHAMEYYLETYTFFATPGKYRFILKYKTYKVKQETPNDSNLNAIEHDSAEVNQEWDQNTSNVPNAPEQSAKTPAKKIKEEIKEEQVQPKPKRIMKNPTVAILTANDQFNFSDEIRGIFVHLQSEMSVFSGCDIKFNIQKFNDPSCPNMVQVKSKEKGQVSLKMQKVRNTRVDPREKNHEVELPLCVNGKLTITQEYRDEIEYDEFNDNPRIKSTKLGKVYGNLTFEKLTHNVRFEIDCVVDSHTNRIKIAFQGSRSRPKKLPSTNLSLEQGNQKPGKKTNPQTIQSPPQNGYPIPSCPTTTYANVVPNNNSSINYNTSTVQQPEQNIYLPPFGSIAPSTSNFIPQQAMTNNYAQPPLFNNSSRSQSVTYTYNNGVANHENTVIKDEFIENPPPSQKAFQSLVTTNQHESPTTTKPKVEIQKVEIITPVKIMPNNINVAPTNNTQVKKISFSALPQNIQHGGGTPRKVVPAQDDELVDFEDAIGNVATPSFIPIVTPKFEVEKSLQKIPDLLKSEKLEQNIRPVATAAKVSVIKSLPAIHHEALQKSPPPLHHYTKDVNNGNNIKNEIRTPTKAEQKILPGQIYDSSVIVRNGIKIEEEETIDLTDDTDEKIDLTVNNTIRRELVKKPHKTKPADITFVDCSEDPTENDRDFMKKSGPSVVYQNAKRQHSPSSHKTKDIKIRLVDVMENLKQEFSLKKNTAVRLVPVTSKSFDKHYHVVAKTEPMEEQPIEEYADDLFDTEFTIVNFNSHRS